MHIMLKLCCCIFKAYDITIHCAYVCGNRGVASTAATGLPRSPESVQHVLCIVACASFRARGSRATSVVLWLDVPWLHHLIRLVLAWFVGNVHGLELTSFWTNLLVVGCRMWLEGGGHRGTMSAVLVAVHSMMCILLCVMWLCVVSKRFRLDCSASCDSLGLCWGTLPTDPADLKLLTVAARADKQCIDMLVACLLVITMFLDLQ
jgi:hypothetical protein